MGEALSDEVSLFVRAGRLTIIIKLNNLIFIECGCGHNEIKWRLSNGRGAEPLNVLHSSSTCIITGAKTTKGKWGTASVVNSFKETNKKFACF